MDQDKSGVISSNELQTLFRLVGMNINEEEMARLMKQVDTNNDGGIDYDEFVNLIHLEQGQRRNEEMEHMFRVFDKGTKVSAHPFDFTFSRSFVLLSFFSLFFSLQGYISAERLKLVLDELGEPTSLAEAEAMIRFADVDRDGQVTLQDFLTTFENVMN